MMRAGLLLAVCLVPTVFGHRNTHAAESVRLLKANETVHASGSDVVFSWEKCVICDGYEARLNLQDISGTRVIPHILKSAVTSLKITDLPPRTVYKLVVKRLPSDVSSSTVSGRTFSPEAPRPVEDLVARVLTNSSIQLEWSSRNADGFMARILEKNTTVQERVFPDFSNHSIVNITNLKPDTDYRVEVTAFYFPPAGNSISPLASARVKTLPVALPDMQLTWKFDSDLELFWKNPDSPSPVKHELQCSAGPSLLKARFDGNTGFVAVPAIFDFDAIDCVLETWFSVDQRSKVVSRVTAVKRKKEQIDQTLPDRFNCPGYGSRHVSTSVGFKVEQINGMELLRLTFSKSNDDNNLAFIEAQYRLCERDGFCDDHWTPVPQTDYPKLLLQQGDLKAWTPYIVQGRFRFRCPYSSSIERDTTPRYLEIPALIGPVVPVTEITATTSMVSWKYNRSSSSPDYFLVTYCTGSDCSSQSVPGDQRSVSLGQLKESSVYYVTIQAVQLRDDRAYVSPTEMTSIVAPKAEASGNVTLKFTEIANSSTVRGETLSA